MQDSPSISSSVKTWPIIRRVSSSGENKRQRRSIPFKIKSGSNLQQDYRGGLPLRGSPAGSTCTSDYRLGPWASDVRPRSWSSELELGLRTVLGTHGLASKPGYARMLGRFGRQSWECRNATIG